MRRHASGPSLRSIAQRAEVSVAAVSMALRNHPRIPAPTRTRIQRLALALGWKPNPLLAEAMSAIRAGQPVTDRVTLAWITAHPRRDGWKRIPFFRRAYEGACARATAAGYHLDHFWLGDADGHAARLSDIVAARGISGVMIAPLPAPNSLALDWSQFSAAAIAYTLTAPRLHRASDNHVASARTAVTALSVGGHRRIGLALSRDQDRRVTGLWTAGYMLQMLNDGRGQSSTIHRPAELEEGEFLEWVDRHNLDAVIGSDNRIVPWLKMSGRRVPDDVSYADLDVERSDGATAGILQDAEGIGAAALDLLAGQLLRHERGIPDRPKLILIESKWTNGQTAPPVTAQAIGRAVSGDHAMAGDSSFPVVRPAAFD